MNLVALQQEQQQVLRQNPLLTMNRAVLAQLQLQQRLQKLQRMHEPQKIFSKPGPSRTGQFRNGLQKQNRSKIPLEKIKISQK